MKLGEKTSMILISTLTLPKRIIEKPTKSYGDNKFNDPSIIKNKAHVDFNDKNPKNLRFVKVNSLPAIREHHKPKYYVDNAVLHNVHESSLLRLDPDENLKIDERNSIFLNSTLTSPKTIIEIITKSYVDGLQKINRN